MTTSTFAPAAKTAAGREVTGGVTAPATAPQSLQAAIITIWIYVQQAAHAPMQGAIGGVTLPVTVYKSHLPAPMLTCYLRQVTMTFPARP